jgi:hypothetical protein
VLCRLGAGAMLRGRWRREYGELVVEVRTPGEPRPVQEYAPLVPRLSCR